MIQHIYIAAIITSLMSLTVIGGLTFMRTPKEERSTLSLLLLLMLPMNAIAYYIVRIPFDGWLFSIMGKENEIYHFIKTLYAPITEEPAKLWPLLIPIFYRRLKDMPIHRVALVIGLGFGVGEAWTVASLLAKSPEIAKYPWYMLGGYISERMMVCIMHAGFTASALVLITKRKKISLGLLACMLLHFMGNFPIFMAKKSFFDLKPETWQVILQVWVTLYFIIMGSFLAYLTFGKQWLRNLIRGRATCTECKLSYERPIFGINLLHKRYERCPHCKRWHLISIFNEEDKNK